MKTLAHGIIMNELEKGRWIKVDELELEFVRFLKQEYGDNLKKSRGYIYLEVVE